MSGERSTPLHVETGLECGHEESTVPHAELEPGAAGATEGLEVHPIVGEHRAGRQECVVRNGAPAGVGAAGGEGVDEHVSRAHRESVAHAVGSFERIHLIRNAVACAGRWSAT